MKNSKLMALGVAALLMLGITACSGGSDGLKIALLLPESETTRYETFDRPLFEKKVKALCDDCEVVFFNADQNESKQAEQIDSAISQSVDVMVLDPVNGEAAAAKVKDAQDADIPVIAYDRFIEGADYYTSFDNEKVGELQGEALVEATGGKGDILMLNGSPDDPNAAQFKKGAHKAINASELNVVGEYDNPDWSPGNAQDYVTDQLTKHDPSTLAGVYAANDGQAGGVIAALTGAGVSPEALPPVTGQDAEVAAIQRILAGEQYMTIYKPYAPEAEGAAELAVKLAKGEDITGTTNYQGIPSLIHDPIVVTADNVADTVIKDGLYKATEICTADYAAACTDAGVK